MEYENYIWDLGGTLLDNYESSSYAFEAALWQVKERVVLHQEIYEALKVSTDHAIAEFASDVPDFLNIYKKLEAEVLKKPILFDGAKEVLAEIKSSGRKNFMISHRNHQVLEILETAGISDYFTEVVTSDDGFARKPSPDSILYLIAKYQLDPLETVMIGDRPIDIQAGNSAGINTVFFDSKMELEEADQNIKKLTELLK